MKGCPLWYNLKGRPDGVGPCYWTGQRLSPMDMLMQIDILATLKAALTGCALHHPQGGPPQKTASLRHQELLQAQGWDHRGMQFLPLSQAFLFPWVGIALTQAIHRQEVKVYYQFCEVEPTSSLSADTEGRTRQWTRMFPFSSYNNRELSTAQRLAQQQAALISEASHGVTSSVLLNLKRLVP